MSGMTGFLHSLAADPVRAAVATAAALALILAAAVAVKRTLSGQKATDVLTFVAASAATAVTMNGMWRYAGNILHFGGPERVMLFSFLELAMLTEAFRARVNMRESARRAQEAAAEGREPGRVSAGVDGAAVWLIAALSGVLSSLDAASAAEVSVRLTAPLVAAWLWERGLSLYRREAGSVSMWQTVAERVLARLGIAAPSRRTLTESTARWRVVRLAHAAVRAANAGRMTRPYRQWRVRALLVAANEHADLATDPERQELLRLTIGTLRGAESLISLAPPAPWSPPEVTPEGASGDTAEPTPRGAAGRASEGAPGGAAGDAPQMAAEGVPGGGFRSERRRAPEGERRSAIEEANRIAKRNGARKVPEALLLDAVREMFGGGDNVTPYRIAKDLPVGEARAKALHGQVTAAMDADRREVIRAAAK